MKEDKLSILYVGPLQPGGTCLQRLKALQFLGHDITGVDTVPSAVEKGSRSLIQRIITRFFGPRDFAETNESIIQLIKNKSFDILWIDKGLIIKPKTISAAKELYPAIKLISYSPDDMLNPHNQSKYYLDCIPLYDVHITTKSYNVAELRQLGAQKVLFLDNAFCPFTHRPQKVSEKGRKFLGGPVGFIGTFEEDRAQQLAYLAQRGIDVKVWGNWPRKLRNKYPKLQVMENGLWDLDYAKAICSFDINLCFLRKGMRDLQTTRSIEIPACGGFMLAERTHEHLKLFKEGKEAAFFESREELLYNVNYYLRHDQERNRIAAAGRKRCIESGYSNNERLNDIINIIKNLFINSETAN